MFCASQRYVTIISSYISKLDHDSMDETIKRLATILSRLPGVGKRSAERVALHLLTERSRALTPLRDALRHADEQIKTCSACGNFDVSDPCALCLSPRRIESAQLCVVEHVSDIWAIERSGFYHGRYFVLGGALSAGSGNGPQDIGIHRLVERVRHETLEEVIIATGATLDGQTTAMYLSEALQQTEARVTRLAQGMPVGGELNYLDEGTLAAALQRRMRFD